MGDLIAGSSDDARSPSSWAGARLLIALAVFLALVLWLGWMLGVMAFGMLCGLVLLPMYFVNGVLIPLAIGHRCPGCGRRSLSYASCIPFGARFYRCKGCGTRCRRDDPTDPWQDASGAAFDASYSAKPPRFPVSWQLGMAAMVLLSFAGVLLGSALAFAIVPGAGVLASLACWHLFFREVRVPDVPPDAADPGLWDRELDP